MQNSYKGGERVMLRRLATCRDAGHQAELAGIVESAGKLLVGHSRQSLSYGLRAPPPANARLAWTASFKAGDAVPHITL